MKPRLSLSLSFLAMFVSSSSAADETAKAYVDAYDAAVSNPLDPLAGAALVGLLPKITTSFGPPRELFVLEGDLTLDEDDLARYRLQKNSAGRPADENNTELIVHVEDGRLAHWRPGQQTLRYAVLKSTFPDLSQYDLVVADMKMAGQDWVDACAQCKVSFEHHPEFDAVATWDEFQALADQDALRFIVVYNPDASGPIASAFFPTDSSQERMVSIFPEYFKLTGGYTGRGVLRHELGHVLGYRHEHTRNVPGCVFEDANWVPVTAYDPKSVMHYWCGNAGTRELTLSDTDRAGHSANYAAAAADGVQ